ncbi:RTA1 like protein-domain-containing protein [Mycena maculata]|uniref:RTA1 like protein-domain-containing protein n=1 Tax=Mycena maculata TaxID=230809 RepID=A0AAD7KGI6_9AGAR|nr:RTA1 like protein-domain-containing protein [Mycena maculata]
MAFRGNLSMDVADSPYGYIPHEYVGIIFLVLFGSSTLIHVGQAIHYRMWWLLPTAALCGVIELIGWSGRTWSSISPSFADPYMMQIVCTIIAPTPLVAVLFTLFGRVVKRLGEEYSFVTAKWYTIVFISCDFVALVVQGLGGGMLSSESTSADGNAIIGASVMLSGIVVQTLAICMYSFCAAEYLRRYTKDLPLRRSVDAGLCPKKQTTPALRTMIFGMVFCTTCLFIRSIYRIIELGQEVATNFNGKVITTEVYFNVFDGGMVTLAIIVLNFVHPGRFFTPEPDVSGEDVEMKNPLQSQSGGWA